MRFVLAILAILLLATPTSAQPRGGFDVNPGDMNSLRQFYRNRTLMTYNTFHGTQIEYMSGRGKSYLLYPGNQVVLPGEWKLEGWTDPTGLDYIVLCFRYGPNTYNPATGSRGSEWECAPAALHLRDVLEARTGDVFGLRRARMVPFVLGTERTTIDALLAAHPR